MEYIKVSFVCDCGQKHLNVTVVFDNFVSKAEISCKNPECGQSLILVRRIISEL